MTTLSTSDVGDGPVVVLVHGVGIGAWAFADLAASLAADHRVLVPHRRGYGPDGGEVVVPGSATVAEQVDDLLGLLEVRGIGDATFVGVSGGATLVLALAMAAPTVVRAAVVHEPVFGPLAPDLHVALQAAAARLKASGNGPEGVREFMVGLVGEARMASLPAAAVTAILHRRDVIRAEVPDFIAFAPAAEDLARLADVALVATVGARSPEFRQVAARVLVERTAARLEVLDGVRHLPQLDAPEAFEKVVRTAAGER
ncbi:MAG: (E)-2-((N-methylformamido)methylene)succinate hydrolase [Actinomycetota bacterium]|nr:(E)-2-((N-methylformamido)methylene)succinate hydrolase [Actinomycetota bacterium]